MLDGEKWVLVALRRDMAGWERYLDRRPGWLM